MNIHEYQAKQLLSKFKVPTPSGAMCFTPAEAEEAAKGFLAEGAVCVVKAQIHAGGRGKAGGVKLVKSREEAAKAASKSSSARSSSPTRPAPRARRSRRSSSRRAAT